MESRYLNIFCAFFCHRKDHVINRIFYPWSFNMKFMKRVWVISVFCEPTHVRSSIYIVKRGMKGSTLLAVVSEFRISKLLFFTCWLLCSNLYNCINSMFNMLYNQKPSFSHFPYYVVKYHCLHSSRLSYDMKVVIKE